MRPRRPAASGEEVHVELDLTLPPPSRIASQFGQIPHLSDYFGIWSIHEPIFRAAVERINQLDLSEHVKSSAAADAVKSQAGDDYEVTRDGVALFQVSGPMMKSVSSLSGGTSTIRLRQEIRAARKNSDVVAGMLVMDTPGGTAKGNRDLADEVAAFAAAKPLYAFIDDLTASAGVSVASQATKRFANNPTALYGAIGTYSVLIDAKRAADNAGFTVHVIKAGDFKGMGELGTAISEAQLAEAQRIVNALNDEYLAIIASGLNLPVAQIKTLADGRIHPAAQAMAMGLLDGIQSYEQTYRQLVAAASSRAARNPSPSKPRSQTKGATMSQDTTQSPAAATLSELKKQFPKSTADWREKQLEEGATLEQAAVAYAAFQEARATDLQTQLDAANKQAAVRGKKTASLGHDPLLERPRSAQRQAKKSDDETDEDDEDEEGQQSYVGEPIADFNAAVARLAGRNPSFQKRNAAIRTAIHQDPDLYRAYLLAQNTGRKQTRMIEEKLDEMFSN